MPRPLPAHGLCRRPLVAGLCLTGFLATMPPGDAATPNHDEAAVRPYTLPDVLAGPDGKPAGTAEAWRSVSRPHQLGLLEKFVYGRRLPPVPVRVVGDVERADVTLAGDVPARRLQARLRLGEAADAKVVEVLVYLPVAQKPVPVTTSASASASAQPRAA